MPYGSVPRPDLYNDVAYWQPLLTTDKDGKASFEVVFPNNITSWHVFAVAVNFKRQSGISWATVKSIKR